MNLKLHSKIILLCLLLLSLNKNSLAQPFIIRVNTTVGTGTGTTGGGTNTPTPVGQFFLRSGVPVTGVNITVKDITGTTTLHTYTGVSAGLLIKNSDWGGSETQYQIEYSGITFFQFVGFGDRQKLSSVEQWGSAAWTSFASSFLGCTNMQITATDAPVLSSVANLTNMFSGCTALTGSPSMATWNTASATNMAAMFNGCTAFNQNIGSWNTAAVTSFSSMFNGCTAFNQNIGSWNTGAVTNMASMFNGASAFNQNISGWNTAAVTNMFEMFRSASAFNQNIGGWNTAAVTNMGSMFLGASAFNNAGASLASWNTAAVTDMSRMFQSATAFNQNIGGWNTAAVTSMGGMFQSATSFNQDLSAWNVSNVIAFWSMFGGATSFTNQGVSLSVWNPVAATDMSGMFAGCKYNMPLNGSWCAATNGVTTMANMFDNNPVFDQDISCWDVSTVTNFSAMFWRAGSYTNAGASLSTWKPVLATNMSFMFAGSKYNMPLDGNWCDTTLHGVTNMSYMFGAYTVVASPANTVFNQDISCWDVSTVTDFNNMFNGASAFNNAGASLASWNTGAAINMGAMFQGAIAFNHDLSAWNVNKVTNFGAMFQGATSFTNQGISLSVWNPVAAISMAAMFAASKYNMPLNWCDTTLKGVTTMANMFTNNPVFDQDISCWNVSTVTDFSAMFWRATSYTNAGVSLSPWRPVAATTLAFMFAASKYNMPLDGNWCDTTLKGVTSMGNMFGISISNGTPANTLFNQDISCWDVSTVTDFGSMFFGATAFNNGGVSLMPGWNTASATNMAAMFQSATSFRQSLAALNISNVTNMGNFLSNSLYPQTLYDAMLIAWSTAPKKNNVPLGAAPSTYCAGFGVRNSLIGTYGWTITDGGLGCTPGGVVSASLRFWMQAGLQGDTIGTGVHQGLDFSGNSNHFVQATGSRQPLYDSANAINYNAVWNFDGADDYLATAGKISSGVLTPYNVARGSRSASSSLLLRPADSSTLLSASAWEPATATLGEYLTLDLGSVKPLTGIRTTGIHSITGLSHWTTSYTVSYSSDDISYTPIGGTYSGNSDNNGIFDNDFPSIITARYIRIFPQSWNVYPALRADVYYRTAPISMYTVTRQAVRNDNVLINLGYTDANNQYNLRGADAGEAIRFKGLVSGLPALSFDLSLPTPTAIGVPNIISADYATLANTSTIYVDGKKVTSSAGAVVPIDTLTIGGLSSGQTFNGQIAEAIAYAVSFTPIQNERILSYLAVKYGLTKSPDLDGDGTADEFLAAGITEGDYLASNGTTVVWNYNATYHNNVIGIGRDDNQGLNQQISRSSTSGDIIRLSTDNNFTYLNGNHTGIANNLSYVVMGHNTASTTSTQITDVPSGLCGNRIVREWRVQRSGSIIPSFLEADFSGIPAAQRGSATTDYVLLLDQDGDGNFSTGTVTRVVASSIVAGKAVFNNVSFDADGSGSDVVTMMVKVNGTVILVSAGSSETPNDVCIKGGYTYHYPVAIQRSVISFKPNGNIFSPSNLTIDNTGSLVCGAAGTFSNAAPDYYQMTDGTNSVRLSKRLHSVLAPGTFSTGGGVTVRVYFGAADTATMLADAWPGVGTVTGFSGWIKHKDHDAQSVVDSMKPNSINGSVAIVPVGYGTEDGVQYAEFLVSSFSTFGFMATTSATPLPLALVSFDAVKQGNTRSLLSWQSGVEHELAYIDIQHSKEGSTWNAIGKVQAKGSNSDYTFIHNTPSEGRNLYRLRMMNKDGTYAYSPTRVLNFEGLSKTVNVYPNPASEQLNIVLQGNSQNNSYELIDALGRVILKGSLIAKSKNKIDVSSVPMGSYTIRITTDTEVSTEQVQIVK